MALLARTHTQLLTEGIATVDDLSEFNKDDFKQIVDNLKSPPATLNAAEPPVLVPTAPFVLGAKSLHRLKVAAQAVKYYDATARPLSAGGMHYTNCLKTFELQWDALITRGDEDAPDVPKITRNVRITNWSESFQDHVHNVIGVRHAPLAYVIRSDETVAMPPPALAHQRPYSNAHGSVEAELIARLAHNHPLFRDDNQKVFHLLEEATRNTSYSATIKPFSRTKNGRDAYLALISQHAGQDKWEKELRNQENFMKTRVWKGNNNFSLEKFIEQHRAAYISMQQCAEHVPYQLPNENTRVRYLMDNIQCLDAELQAALAAIRLDTIGPVAMRNNFELAVTFLLPTDPVSRRRKEHSNSTNANVSSTTATNNNSVIKPSKGARTGVELRYFSIKDYKNLSRDEKMELREWRDSKKSDKKRDSSNDNTTKDDHTSANKKLRKTIASVMKEEAHKVKQQEDQKSELTAVLLDIIKPTSARASSTVGSTPSSTAEQKASVMATKLQGILKRGGKSNVAE